MATSVIATDQTNFAWSDLVDDLNRLLRLRTTPIGMKLFERREDMEAIPKLIADWGRQVARASRRSAV